MGSSPTDPGPVNRQNACAGRLFFVIGMMLTLPTLSVEQSLEHLIAKGDALRRQFDTQGAYESYLAAYTLDSNNAEVLCRLSLELIDMGNELPRSDDQRQMYDRALFYSRRAARVAKDSARVYSTLGYALEKKALYESGKTKVKLLNELHAAALISIRSDSNNAMGYFLAGRWHMILMDVSWLVREYSEWTEGRLPEEPSYVRAESNFLRAVELSKEPIAHFMELGKTYVRMENWHDARLVFEEIVFLPSRVKNDNRWKRDARKYLGMLEAADYAPLKDSVEE